MAEDRRATGIVAKRLAQSVFACPMMRVREVRLAAGMTWRAAADGCHYFVHLAAGRLAQLPARATVLLPPAATLRALATARLQVVPLAFHHPHAGDPLRELVLPAVVAEPAAGPAWRLILAVAAAARTGDGWARVRGRGLVLAQVGAFLGRARVRRAPRAAPAWLAASLMLMRRRLADPTLAVADLAVTSGLSSDAFGRAFRAATGGTPWAMVLGLRLALAESLLRDVLPVKTVAARSGFASSSRLITAFRRRHRRPPAAWVRRAARG